MEEQINSNEFNLKVKRFSFTKDVFTKDVFQVIYASVEKALSSQLTLSLFKHGKIFNLVIHLNTKMYFQKIG